MEKHCKVVFEDGRTGMVIQRLETTAGEDIVDEHQTSILIINDH